MPLIMDNPMNNGFTITIRWPADGLNLLHTLITIRVDVDLALLFVAHITAGVASINPNAARPAGDPSIDRRDILDHWDEDTAAYGDLHPLHVYATNARDYTKYIH